MGLSAIFTFVGGIGLFLLGMRLMTDGFKVAAGDTLRTVLVSATRSRLRGLVSGVLITAMVQSSSAVIFATIGFVNAGLLTLYQSVGIIYGSNLGTTLTSWIVALAGFDVDIRALAMPAIGIGMVLWVTFGGRRKGAMGQALTGLGLFFLGIDVLQETFAELGDEAALERLTELGAIGLLLFTAAGVLLTVLMQSSSAALAVTLTAAAGGLIPLSAAAAMVIGANVGTTSTAAFAVIGATAPAKRAASAHVLFNVITAVVAFMLLPLLLWIVGETANLFRFSHQPAILLAIFHTLTKLLGVGLMWPLTGWLVSTLERRFRSAEEDLSRPRFLDSNIQTAPALAMDALALELHRMNGIARDMARAAISTEAGAGERLVSGRRVLENLNLAMADFASGIARNGDKGGFHHSLPDALRVGQYLVNMAEASLELSSLEPRLAIDNPELVAGRNRLWAMAVDLLGHTGVDDDSWDRERLADLARRFEAEYQAHKRRLLHSGTQGELNPRSMALALEQLSALHRTVDQAIKAARYLDHLVRRVPSGSDQTEEQPEPVSP